MGQERLMILEKTLSGLSGYRGWMIGTCRFSFGREDAPEETSGQPQQTCQLAVLRSDARLAEVEITHPETGDQLRVMLVNAVSGKKPVRKTAGKQLPDTKAAAPQNEIETFLVTREEIDAYLQASRDENPIHRGENAVVPGFLMVNRILEGYGNAAAASVRFCQPLCCGKPAKLAEQKTGEHSRTVELFTDQGRILQMKLQEKDKGGEQR